MANNNMTYNATIKFNADTSGLKELKNTLKTISYWNTEHYMDLTEAFNTEEAKKELIELQQNAKKLEIAYDKAFNMNTGTLNFNKFNTILKQSNIDLTQLANSFQLVGAKGSIALNNLLEKQLRLNTSTIKISESMQKMWDSLSNAFRYNISASVLNTLSGAVSSAYSYAKKLDSSLNDIRIVSNKSAKEMQTFAKYANSAAKALGTSTTDYTEASLIYYQQGLSEEEVLKRTEVTVKAANALGSSASEVSDYMTAIWNNFAKGSENLEYYADVLTKLGAATASSSEEIAEGLGKFSAVAETVGLSYEYATASLATVVAETRESADTVGTAFKTIFSRLQGLKLGETLDDGTTLNKYSTALNTVGVNVKDASGNLRNLDDILNDLGSKWDSLTTAQQTALAQTVAGSRQYNTLVALMNNWEEVQENVNLALESSGTLEEQNAIYLESLEAHLQKTSTAAEALYDNLIDEDAIKFFADLATSVLKVANVLTQGTGGGLSTLSLILGKTATLFKTQLAEGIVKTKSLIEQLSGSLKSNADAWKELRKQNLEYFRVIANGENQEINGGEVRGKVIETHQKISDLKNPSNELIDEKNKVTANALMAENTLEQRLIDNNAVDSYLRLLTGDNKGIEEYEDTKLDEVKGKIDAITFSAKQAYEIINKIKNEETAKWSQQDIKNMLNFFGEDGEIKENFLDTYFEKQFKESRSEEPSEDVKKQIKLYSGTIYGILNEGLAEMKNVPEGTSIKQIEDNLNLLISGALEDLGNMDFDLSDFMESLAEASKDTSTNVSDNMSKSTKEVRQDVEDTIEKVEAFNIKLDEVARNEAIIEIGSAFLQVGSAIGSLLNSVQSLSDIWKSEDSTISKLAQTLGLLVTIAYTVATAITAVKTAFNAKTISTIADTVATLANKIAHKSNQKAINEETKAINKQTAALIANATAQKLTKSKIGGISNLQINNDNISNIGQEFNLSGGASDTKATSELIKSFDKLKNAGKKLLGVIKPILSSAGPYIAVAAAVAAATYVVYRALTVEEHAVKKTKEAWDEANKTAEESRTAYKELQTTISEYNTAVDSIKSLTDGTVEFYEAIETANEKAQDLIDKYELLAGYDYAIDENGMIVINDNAKNRITKAAKAEMYQDAANANQKSIDYYTAQQNLLIKDYAKATGGTKSAARSFLSGDYTTDENGNITLNNASETSIGSRFASILLKEANPLGTSLVNLSTQMLKTKDYTIEAGNSLAKYNALQKQISNAYDSMGSNIIKAYSSDTQLETYNGMTSETQSLLNRQVAERASNNANNKSGFKSFWDTSDENWFNVLWKGALQAVIAGVATYYTGGAALPILLANAAANDDLSDKEIKETYAKEVLGYTDDDLKSNSSILKNIDLEVAKTAYESGAFGTSKYLEEILSDISASKTEAIDKGGITSQQSLGYISGAYAAAKLGDTDYNYSLLTDEEIAEVKRQLEENNIEIPVNLDTAEFNEQLRNAANLTEYNNELEAQASVLGTTKNALRAYGAALKAVNKDLDENSKETADQIANEYKLNKTYNETKKTYKDNQSAIEAYMKAVKKGTIPDYEAADAMGEMITALEKMGITLSNDDLTDNTVMETIKNLMSDSAEEAEKAYNKLKENSWLNDLTQNFGLADSAAKEFINTLNSLETGKDLTLSDSILTAMQGTKKNLEDWKTWAEDYNIEVNPITDASELEVGGTKRTTTHTVSSYIDDAGKSHPGYTYTETITEDPQTLYGIGDLKLTKKAGSTKTSKSSFVTSSSNKTKSSSSSTRTTDEVDRYKTINMYLKSITKNLSLLANEEDKLLGTELTSNLEKQTAEYQKQLIYQKEKYEMQKEQASELQTSLSKWGFTFGENGEFANYWGQRNYLDELYKAGKITESQYKQVTGWLDTYSSLYEEMLSSEEEIQEIQDKRYETLIKMVKLQAEYAETLEDIVSSYAKYNALVNEGYTSGSAIAQLSETATKLENAVSDYGTYVTNMTKLETLMGYTKDWDTNEDNPYYNNQQGLFDEINSTSKSVQESTLTILEYVNSIGTNWTSGMEEANQLIDDQIDSWNTIESILEKNANLATLIYGEKVYGTLLEIEKQERNIIHQELELSQEKADQLKEDMDYAEKTFGTNSEEYKKAKQLYEQQINTTKELAISEITKIKEVFETSLSKSQKENQEKLLGGLGLDYANQEWEILNANDEKFYDEIEKTYSIQSLANKYNDAINGAGTEAQKKLNALKTEEINKLKTIKDMDENDLKIAEARLEVEKAKIALEEAQANKSTLRLRRDSQGNYTYQYTADQSQITQAEEEYETASYNYRQTLYDTNKSAKAEMAETISWWEEQYNSIMTNSEYSPEQKAKLIADISETALQQYSSNALQIERTNEELIEANYNYLKEHNSDLTEEQLRKMAEELVPGYASATNDIVSNSSEAIESFKKFMSNVQEDGTEALATEEDDINSVLDTINTNAEEVESGTDSTVEALEEMQPTLEGVTKDVESLKTEVKGLVEELLKLCGIDLADYEGLESYDTLADAFEKIANCGKSLVNTANEWMDTIMINSIEATDPESAVAQAIAKYKEAAAEVESALEARKISVKSNSGSSNSGNNTTSSNNTTNSDNKTTQRTLELHLYNTQTGKTQDVAVKNGNSYTLPKPTSVVEGQYFRCWTYNGFDITSPTIKPIQDMTLKTSWNTVSVINDTSSSVTSGTGLKTSATSGTGLKKIVSGATGGYTGEWGSEGKLAILHEKELILNKEDTKNILNSVSILRAILNPSASNGASVLNSLNNSSENSTQNVTINAEFPNATNHTEIEEAIKNLANMAVMRINK